LSQTEIIQEAKNKIETFKPDVILLDLRLCDIDFEDELPSNKLTGIQILDIVKNINKGIQVIITTASNKVWNFEAAKKYGANGYIIKSGISNIKEDIKNLKTLIEEGLKRSSFLKIINQKLKAAIQCWDNYKIHQRRNLTDQMHDTLWHANLKLQIKDFLNNAFDTINNDEIQERFTISILLLYRVIEMLNEFFIVEEGTYFKKDISYKFDIDDQPVPRISFNTGNYNIETLSKGKTLSTKEKAYAIYHKYKNVTPKDLFKMINNLTEYRNKVAIHPDKRFKEESLEYLFENKFDDFKRIIVNHFNAVMNYVNSFN
jgi:CheY-like chemotaxis protein